MVHTSDKIHGQIYIPEINWILMVLCIAVTIGFRDTKHLGNASGTLIFAFVTLAKLFSTIFIFSLVFGMLRNFKFSFSLQD